MNKFIIFVLLSLTIACSTGQPGGKVYRAELPNPSRCYWKEYHEKNECCKTCGNKTLHHLDEKEVKKIKQCYEENGCPLPIFFDLQEKICIDLLFSRLKVIIHRFLKLYAP